jgi:UDP-3-O-[3-hydroxymyristoyl] glucosamine N-acyltransferase
MATTVEALARISIGEVHGDQTLVIDDAQPIDQAGPQHVTYAGDRANLKKLSGCDAGAVFLNRSLFEQHASDLETPAIIVVE